MSVQDVKDSIFVNFIASIEKFEHTLKAPKKRGVRGPKQGATEAGNELKDDLFSIIGSPLSKIKRVDPVPGLGTAQIEALRALYAVLNNGHRDKELEAVLMTAVERLNPHFAQELQEEKALDGDRKQATGPIRRSERLAQLAQKAFTESDNDGFEELFGEEDDEDDEGADQEAQNAQEDEEDQEMDDVQ